MLNIQNLDLHYGAAQALKSVSLQAKPGEVTAVLGRNGVGKTSLMRAITGRHPTSGGRIEWQGKDIAKLRSDRRAQQGIASVPQGREIFPLLTVRENLETGFATLKRTERSIPDDVFNLFPVL
ncbi:MAG: ATP-binding cassette domain-containing protein, partial [Pseudomonadota bacterium]